MPRHISLVNTLVIDLFSVLVSYSTVFLQEKANKKDMKRKQPKVKMMKVGLPYVYFIIVKQNLSPCTRKPTICNKGAVTAKLMSIIIFATRIV